MLNERRTFVVVVIAATALRLAHTATSLGSTDAYLWSLWAGLLDQAGVLRSYQYDQFVNHPPLALAIALACGRLAETIGLQFVDVFRGLQSAADIVTATALVRIATLTKTAGNRYAPAIAFLLSPAAIFISGFHCNTDPLMMMFVALAAMAALADRPLVSGTLFALAVGIKIVPLLLGPLFFLAAFREGRARIRFVAAGAAVSALIFGPALIVSGLPFVQRVFGYSGVVRGWGLPVVCHVLEKTFGWSGLSTGALKVLPIVEIAAVLAIAVVAWQRRLDTRSLPQLLGATLLIVLVFAPGFGLQYLFWPLPFLWFALDRPFPLAVHGAVGTYLFAVYTAWSRGWPWWYAERAASVEISRLLTTGAGVLWLVLIVAATLALYPLFVARSTASAKVQVIA